MTLQACMLPLYSTGLPRVTSRFSVPPSMQPDGEGYLGDSPSVIVDTGAFLTWIRCHLTAATYGQSMLQRHGLSNGRGEYTNSMNGWRTSSVVSAEEVRRAMGMTTMALSRRLLAPTDRKGLLHKMQAGKDDNSNPTSRHRSSRSGIRYDCENYTYQAHKIEQFSGRHWRSNEFAVSMRRAKARTLNSLNRCPPIRVALPRVTDGVRVFGGHKQLAVSYMNSAFKQVGS
ncbi:hypothetical protein EV421DRAFT_1157758 [Armillaria borealis]|uniref:Uncharacterized protein n=1 Tax=Armillaria borealis TaxID=47425 RepID=A0AA39J5V2_9AGAR|nr:hypothetical protein EV421DRAFT_1157758 [Armillaria borealis]